LQLHDALNLTVLEKGQAETMGLGGSKLFVITAGMMSENTAAHDLALRMMGDPRMAIFFVGYADPDTPAGRLRAAKQGETFLFSAGGGEGTRKCEIDEFDLTAHANRDELLNFVTEVNPRTVLLGHGDQDAREWFEQQIRARHPKMQIIQPGPGKEVEV
jgi:Cft2 family RNA processing exonuclease